MSIAKLFLVAPVGSVLALIFAYYFYKKMISASGGNDKMKKIRL